MEERIKQRLVGAIVLVALAVIFIPMILQGPGGSSGSENAFPPPPKVVQQSLPPVPAPHSAALPLAPNGVAMGRIQNGTTAQSAASGTGKQGVTTPNDTVTPASPAPVPEAGNGSLHSGGTDQGLAAWVVQVGSFTRQDSALSLRDKLRAKGFNAFVEQARVPEGTVFRVEVGPVVKRSAADGLREKLQVQMQLKGLVTPHQ